MIPTAETRASCLIEALPYIQRFRGAVFVIKYGGAAMEDEEHVECLLRDVVFLEAVGINPVLVHGGGKAITAKMRAAGLPPRFARGLRLTCERTIHLAVEALDGEINPRLVETIRAFGGRAVGISGTRVFTAEKLGSLEDESGQVVDPGFVGEVRAVELQEIAEAIQQEVVPVISPLGSAPNGHPLNINADTAAAALARKLQAQKLIYISDVPGIMRDPEDPQTLIPSIHAGQVEGLAARKVLTGGMIPKVHSAVEALRGGVGKVHFLGGTLPHSLLLEIFTDAGVGTEITL